MSNNIDIELMCTCVSEDEKLIVYRVINDDYAILQFMVEMAHEKYILFSCRRTATVNIFGLITPVPAFYFYLTGVFRNTDGGRQVCIGIINKTYELFAEVDVCFQIYPVKSAYLRGFTKQYKQPHMYVKPQIKTRCITKNENVIFTSVLNVYIRQRVEDVLLLLAKLYYYYDEDEIVKQCLQKHNVLLSVRLTQVLKYTRGLLMRVTGYMSMWCECGALRQNIDQHCMCEDIILFLHYHYYRDTNQICNDAVYFNSYE